MVVGCVMVRSSNRPRHSNIANCYDYSEQAVIRLLEVIRLVISLLEVIRLLEMIRVLKGYLTVAC